MPTYVPTYAKNGKKQSVSKMIDLVMTIKTHTESSKSELSSRGKRPFKVSTFCCCFDVNAAKNNLFSDTKAPMHWPLKDANGSSQ